MRRTHAISVHVCEKQSQVLHKSHEIVVEDDTHLLKLEVFSEDKLNALL